MRLTKRLNAIVNYITPGKTVADIGTGHLQLPLYLVKTKRSPRVIATEYNLGPYQIACFTVALFNEKEKIELRQGNGLLVLKPGEAEIVVIAGVGGNTICQLLFQAPNVLNRVKRLVLQPATRAGDLRCWLAQNNWRLVEEVLVDEKGHFYPVMAAEPGIEVIQDKVLLAVGPRLVEKNDPLLPAYLEKQIQIYRRILTELAGGQNPAYFKKRRSLETIISKLNRLLARCYGKLDRIE